MTDDGAPIAAIATAAGKGAVGIVRVSGPAAAVLAVARTVTGRDALRPRHAHYLTFTDDDGRALDEGLALLFVAPHSYTGETVLELQGHGGPVVMRALLARVLRAGRSDGIRLAQPGEFTLRAYHNGRIDLAQAEAVADLIDASSEQAARSATRSLQGEFSARIDALAAQTVDLRALTESTLDFPEEEIDFLTAAGARQRLADLRAALDAVLAAARHGAVLRSGLVVVLAGRPNAGKSSLLNALAGDDVAIVSPVAGTTRDRVVQTLDLDGLPVHVVDTAGLRRDDDPDIDPVERIGIARTWNEIRRADVIVQVVDAGDPGAAVDAGAGDAGAGDAGAAEGADSDAGATGDPDEALARAIAGQAPAGAVHLRVLNKTDLLTGPAAAADRDAPDVIRLSARTGDGVGRLRARLQAVAGHRPGAEDVFIARERHVRALHEARAHLASAAALLARGDEALELLAEELRLAHAALQSITGTMSADDLLGVVFSRFCIGK